MQNIIETLNIGISKLEEAKTDNPFLEAELLLEHVVGIKRLELHSHCFDPIFPDKEKLFFEYIERRAKHEPIQYIIGYTEFLDYHIIVTPEVLIPRPETELLVDYIKNDSLQPGKILDIGTGSGAIAISLKKLYPGASVYATDISKEAINIAKKNAEINHVEITFCVADLFPIDESGFDLIVSNPPYIKKSDYDELPMEVRDYEPENALLAEESGLLFYDRIIEKSRDYLSDSGVIYFEIGEEQALDIVKLAEKNGFTDIDIFQDLCDKDRYIRINHVDEDFDLFKLL